MILARRTAFWEGFLAPSGFRPFFEFGDFFGFAGFSAEAFFAVCRAMIGFVFFDFVFFAIATLPAI
ncbi:hypothetical protein [Bradyrhizobium sp. S69]|uniref:hypothetical protein n=1 Tax=Bradyrhizobium sp. S69 TaxID=1641856 RepID=UPI00131E8220|nr:hypothetical protein [Bradyrhizobium sp. S69]